MSFISIFAYTTKMTRKLFFYLVKQFPKEFKKNYRRKRKAEKARKILELFSNETSTYSDEEIADAIEKYGFGNVAVDIKYLEIIRKNVHGQTQPEEIQPETDRPESDKS